MIPANFNKLLVLALACLVNYASANGRYNIAVQYHMASEDSDCHDVSDRLFRVTTLSLMEAGIELDDEPEHWESFMSAHNDMLADENKEDKAIHDLNHDVRPKPQSDAQDERRLVSKYVCRFLCQSSGSPVYCQCCGDLCGGHRRRLNVGLRKGHTDDNMDKVIAKAEMAAVKYLNQWHFPIKCLKYDEAAPHYSVTVKMMKHDNGVFKPEEKANKKEPCCPAGHTGLVPYDDCTQFVSCVGGRVMGAQACNTDAGLLFDPAIQVCNHAYNVNCPTEPVC